MHIVFIVCKKSSHFTHSPSNAGPSVALMCFFLSVIASSPQYISYWYIFIAAESGDQYSCAWPDPTLAVTPHRLDVATAVASSLARLHICFMWPLPVHCGKLAAERLNDKAPTSPSYSLTSALTFLTHDTPQRWRWHLFTHILIVPHWGVRIKRLEAVI